MIKIEDMVGNTADHQRRVNAILHTDAAHFEQADMAAVAETIKLATAYINQVHKTAHFIDNEPFSAALSRLNADCMKALRLLSQQSMQHIFPKPDAQ